MATALEIAQRKEQDKLRRAGLNSNGSPIDNQAGGRKPAAEEDDETDEEREERLRLEQEEDDEDDQNGLGQGDDDLRSQVKALQSQLSALQGRVAPSQQAAAEYQRLWQTEKDARVQTEQQLRAQIEALEADLEERSAKLNFDSLLTEEEKKDIDPIVLAAMQKIAKGMVERSVPKVDVRASTLQVLEERDKQRVIDHRNRVMNDPTRGLHKLSQLAYDPAFIAWTKEEDNDVDSVVTSLLNAKSTEEVDRYAKIVAKRIAAFGARDKAPPADARTRMGGHMRRGEKPRMSAAERQAKLDEAKNLSRSRNPADRKKAQAILDSL